MDDMDKTNGQERWTRYGQKPWTEYGQGMDIALSKAGADLMAAHIVLSANQGNQAVSAFFKKAKI
jgi:hypothetical protein